MSQDNLKYQTKKGLYWKFAEQFSNYGIQFIVGIFMARMLSPEDYGLTALPAVFMAISGIFVSGGFGTALVRKPDLTEKDLSTAFYYSMGVGVLCYVVLFVASPWIADFYNAPVLVPLMRVTALSFLYSPLGTGQSVILQRRLDFKTPTKVSVICRILSGVIGIVMAYTGYGVWALVISGFISGIIGQVITFWVVRWYPKAGWSKESFRYLWGYGNKIMGSFLLGTVYENIAPVIIGKYFSPAQLGVYNRAQGYAKMPSQNMTGTLQSVTFPVLSQIQNDDERLARSYRKMLRVSAFIVFPLMMMLAALARPLVLALITAKWEACIVLLQIMCLSMMWYPIHAINLNLLEVKGRSDLFFRLEIIKRSIGLLLLVCTLPLGLVAFCWGGVAGSMVSLFINTYYTGKIIHVGYVRQMRDLAHILLLSFLMYGVIWLVLSLLSNLWAQIIVGGICGTVFYLGCSYLFKFSELQEVKYLLSRKK